MLDPPMKRLMPLLLLAVGSFAGADDPAPPDHTQDLEVENCTVHSTLDDFTDEVLRAALECHGLISARFRVEYVYESGEIRLNVPDSGGLMERRVTLDFRAGRRPAFSFTATQSGTYSSNCRDWSRRTPGRLRAPRLRRRSDGKQRQVPWVRRRTFGSMGLRGRWRSRRANGDAAVASSGFSACWG